MSGAYIPSSDQLHGWSIKKADCMGKPHIGAEYVGFDVRPTTLKLNARCANCGQLATNAHHEPPIGAGKQNSKFTLSCERGVWILQPALISLCGSGTTGCHGLRHTGNLTFEWKWRRDDYARAWWEGELLEQFLPHDTRLYAFGYWVGYDKRRGRLYTIEG